MKTNLEHYKTFYTVAKLGNISDAAEELIYKPIQLLQNL